MPMSLSVWKVGSSEQHLVLSRDTRTPTAREGGPQPLPRHARWYTQEVLAGVLGVGWEEAGVSSIPALRGGDPLFKINFCWSVVALHGC